jgi:zinc transporter 9
MAGNGSKTAVYTAIGANTIVAIAKGTAFAMTGSGAMLSECLHSMADVGNQALLAVGMRNSERPADATHPEGYGKEAFIWSIISAVGMFFLGCGASIMHGIHALGDAHGAHADPGALRLNIGILLFALVIEGGCLLVAIRGLRADAKLQGQSLREYLKRTDDPFGVAVLLEDSAAVLGVLMALTAILLTQRTGHSEWDAIGSIAIGVLLGCVAVYLIAKNRSFLIGRAIDGEQAKRVLAVLESDPAVRSVSHERGVVRGTKSFQYQADITFNGAHLARQCLAQTTPEQRDAASASEENLNAFIEQLGEAMVDQMAAEVDRLEDVVREATPKASDINLEPN